MSVTSAKGFQASGVACGIKGSGELDLALVVVGGQGGDLPGAGDRPRGAKVGSAAAVFTSNLAAAAPVQVSRRHMGVTKGRIAGVVLNSGNANAATGPAGVAASQEMCDLVARELGVRPQEILACSTGLIGMEFPNRKVAAGIPDLVAGLGGGPASGDLAARAIMTTDTVPKQAVVSGSNFTLGAMAKGAAMLAPNMATMLAVLTTDASCDPEILQDLLRQGVESSFNRLSVDGATSTNDTVILLASGVAGPADPPELASAISQCCKSLSDQMAMDAEGATKYARIVVTGASSDAEAASAARKVAESVLVRCSLYGKDPYWGRIVSELGSAGVSFDLDRVTVSYGSIAVCEGGVGVAHDERGVAEHMEGRRIEVEADLGLGEGRSEIVTTDLTHAYVDENMGTS